MALARSLKCSGWLQLRHVRIFLELGSHSLQSIKSEDRRLADVLKKVGQMTGPLATETVHVCFHGVDARKM